MSVFFSCYNLNAGLEPCVCENLRDATPASATPASSFSLLLVHSLSSFILNAFTRWLPGFWTSGISQYFSYLGECSRFSFWTFPLCRVDLYLHYVFVSGFYFCAI